MSLGRAMLGAMAVVLPLASCALPNQSKPTASVSVGAPTKSDEWLRIATPADEQKIANVSGAWAAGLGEARRANFASALREEARLLKQDGALDRPAPTPGSYNCRLVKLGGKPAFEMRRTNTLLLFCGLVDS